MLRKGNRKGTSRRIAEYIYEDDIGRRAIAHVKGRRPREKRFAASTPLSEINRWLKDTRKQLSDEAASIKRLSPAGTLGSIITRYLETIVNATSHRETSALLVPWMAAVGMRPIRAISSLELRRVVNEWIDAGIAASTVNHRRRELAKAWDAVLPGTANLVRQVPRVREPRPEDRGFDMWALDAVINTIPDRVDRGQRRGQWNVSKPRLRVMLWTGFPSATLGRISPHDVDLDRGGVRLQPRRKAAGADAVWIPLFPEGLTAFRQWLDRRAHGKIDHSSLWKAFRRAYRAYRARLAKAAIPIKLPPDLSPYDLRHSFLTWLVDEKDADPYTVQFFGQHASLTTTQRYVRRAIARRAEKIAKGERAKRVPKVSTRTSGHA